MKRTVKWKIASLAIMALIFWFSQKNATQSSAQSDFFLFLLPFLQDDTARTILRKMAHFTIYTVLGFCVGQSLPPLRPVRAFWVGVSICFLYACSDELHQSLIPGRSCQFTDVLIDTAGSCLGLFLSGLFYKKWE